MTTAYSRKWQLTVLAALLSAPAILTAAPEPNIALQVIVQDFTWREDVGQPLRLKESGWLYGIGVNGRLRQPERWQLHYRAQFYGGEVDYDGFLQYLDGRVEPYQAETRYLGAVGDLDASFLLNEGDAIPVRPFIGIGTRYWLRELDKREGFGYDEYWLTIYGRLGLNIEVPESSARTWFLSMALVVPVYNYEWAVDVPLLPDDNIELKPKRKLGQHLEAGVRGQRFQAALFYEALNFGQSDLDRSGMFFQPASEKRLAGLRVGMAF
ncbi:MAG TPA: hypothetical protein PKE26_02780 [Kiritimatiellia bacterium]|nr:hypothetical protein [Kiritimatiellia bacterium]HMO98013.1 hypothetical protein [Kiritimatiellia bacterium]HMP97464.1 hypothetical protein [Kiritimatiellia bacterium]